MTEIGQRDNYTFHKERYADSAANRDDRVASGEWLLDNGFIGLDGRAILLNGKLPEEIA